MKLNCWIKNPAYLRSTLQMSNSWKEVTRDSFKLLGQPALEFLKIKKTDRMFSL
jgi:hypothetical protein